MSIRPVKRLVKSKPTLEGAGVHLRRAFGFENTQDVDPFLLLDDFFLDDNALAAVALYDKSVALIPYSTDRGDETIANSGNGLDVVVLTLIFAQRLA